MRDMVPRNDRSIRNIPVPTGHRRIAVQEDEVSMHEPVYEEERRRPMARQNRGGRRWFWISAIGVVVVCVAAGLLLSTLFAGASVTVYPRTETVASPKSMTAQLNAPVGGLQFVTISTTRSATTTVPASGTKQVSRQASGMLTIYNSAGTASQRLIANTRFEAPDGKIYRIHDSVVVPGATKKADGGFIPGSTQTSVYADSAGADYNRGETRFTIPGFKSDPRYTQFYATANAITGGFVGQEPSVAPADLSKAEATMQQTLSDSVRSVISNQIPEGFIPIPGALQVSFGPVIQSPGDANNATISETATAVGALVRATSLASALAKQLGSTAYKGEAVDFADLTQVHLTATSSKIAGAIDVQIVGTPAIVWQFDARALQQALLGKPKGTFQTIVQSFQPGVTRADAKIRPFWQSTFPSDPAKITITTATP